MDQKVALVLCRVGFLCGKYSTKPIPTTTAELVAIIQDAGIDSLKGLTLKQIDEKVEKFIKNKRYAHAMKVVV